MMQKDQDQKEAKKLVEFNLPLCPTDGKLFLTNFKRLGDLKRKLRRLTTAAYSGKLALHR